MSRKNDKIIIVGAGVFGLSTAWHLSQQGYGDITVFDSQPYDENLYDPAQGCDAASADVNKIYRCGYGNEVEYQDLAYSGRPVWNQWNEKIAAAPPGSLPNGITPDTVLFVNSGLLRLSTESALAPYDLQSLDYMEAAGLRHHQHVLSNSDDRARIAKLDAEAPGKNWPSKMDLFSHVTDSETGNPLDGYFDTSAGFTRADKACIWVRHLCETNGVKFVLGPVKGKLEKLREEQGAGVKTIKGIQTADGAVHEADLVIVAAGGWTPSLLPGLGQLLETTAGSVVTVKIPEDRPDLWEKYSPDNFPVLTYGLTGHNSPVYGGLYGFPRTEAGEIKIGYRGRKWTNYQESPVTGERVSTPRTAYSSAPIDTLPKIAIQCLRKFIDTFWSDLSEIGISKTRLCWYTDSYDNNFVIDYVPGYDKTLFVCSGGSGHGFKFLPVLGKHVVNQIESRSDQFTPLWRYRKADEGQTNLNGLEEGETGERLLHKLEMAQRSDWK